jgi:MFS family permease
MLRSYGALVRSERSLLLFGLVCTFLSGPGQTFFIAQFVGSFQEGLSLGAAHLGTLYLAATLGAASLLPVVGYWIDRLDLRLYVVLVVAGLATACFAAAASAGPASLFVAFLLLRLTGQGLMTHTAVTSIARYFENQRGKALSLTSMGFPLAEGILPVCAVLLISGIGWRASYATIGAFALIGAMPLLLALIRSRPTFTEPSYRQGAARPPRITDALRIVLPTRFFWLALPILLFMPFTSTALIFHVETIAGVKAWSRELVAAGFIGYALGHAAGLLFSGGLVDRFSARALLPFMNVPLLLGLLLLASWDASAALFLFLALTGFASGLVQTTVSAVWAEVYGVERLGTIRSFAVMLMVAGTAAGPAVLGTLLDRELPVATIASGLLTIGIAASLLAIAATGRSAELRRHSGCSESA